LITAALEQLAPKLAKVKARCPFDVDNALYFSERDRIEPRKTRPRMVGWRRMLFSFLSRNSVHPADRFNLPAENFVGITRVREL